MKIRQRKSKRGTVSWQVDFGTASGRRVQRSYKSREEAEAAQKAGVKTRKKFGILGQSLNPSDVAEFILARERLGGVSLIAAVEFYLANAKVIREPVLMPALVKRFIDAKERQGRRERYVGQLPVSLGSFARTVELKHAHEVEKEDVEAWLHGNGWAPKTRNNYLGAVKTLFAWAVKMKHAAKNPCEDVERSELPDSEIEVLSVEEASALLHMALEPKHRPLLGFVVIGLFCGVRPEEQQRMHWDAVDLTAGTLIVAGVKAKTRKRRVVDIPTNARAWLGEVKSKKGKGISDGGKICPPNFVDRWRALREACGWSARGGTGARPWPHDGMRHTFASMHYAWHQNEAMLQTQMGHESKEELHRHYRAITTRAEAGRFWKLMPPGKRGRAGSRERGAVSSAQ